MNQMSSDAPDLQLGTDPPETGNRVKTHLAQYRPAPVTGRAHHPGHGGGGAGLCLAAHRGGGLVFRGERRLPGPPGDPERHLPGLSPAHRLSAQDPGHSRHCRGGLRLLVRRQLHRRAALLPAVCRGRPPLLPHLSRIRHPRGPEAGLFPGPPGRRGGPDPGDPLRLEAGGPRRPQGHHLSRRVAVHHPGHLYRGRTQHRRIPVLFPLGLPE